jgi:hypothetical protein
MIPCILFALVIASTPASAAPCAAGGFTASATFPNDPGFEGMWKYTLSGSWDTGEANGLSHISFLIDFECPCVCEDNFAVFPTPAGTATGTDSSGADCTVDFIGINECEGDPTIPNPAPAIKFEAPEGQGCETGQTGSGTWFFYSGQPPLPDDTYTDAVVVKYGVNDCSLDLSGQLPDCTACAVPTEPSTWGKVKALYGD